MITITHQDIKGQVFLKYLWHHKDYKTSNGALSPLLIQDLLTCSGKDNLNISKLFLCINNQSIIPKWLRLAAFRLAISKGWQPIDLVDVLSVVHINKEKLQKVGFDGVFRYYKENHNIFFPEPLIREASNYELK